MSKRASTTKKISKADQKAILSWLARNAPHGVILRLRGQEIGVVGVDLETGLALTDDGEQVPLKNCTILKETVARILDENKKAEVRNAA